MIHREIVELLALSDSAEIEQLRSRAEAMVRAECGDMVSMRGLIEFSNVCVNDCYYCGIGKNCTVDSRYTLTHEQIVDAAKMCADLGYGSLVLQSGERHDESFIDFVVEAIRSIKSATRSNVLPEGLGITACVGEQSFDAYKRLFDAGAHRFLLRVETTNNQLFEAIHHPSQKLKNRIACLQMLKDIGFQVGTGVMIGLPGQTLEMLADDILFFKLLDVDMIGMGPYIVHHATSMARFAKEIDNKKEYIYNLSLRMIAVTRLFLRDVNIAATTALQAMHPKGREDGLRFGANVIMPQVTPTDVRLSYQLYDGKPCLDETASQCSACIGGRIASVGRSIAYNSYGDSPHARRKKKID